MNIPKEWLIRTLMANKVPRYSPDVDSRDFDRFGENLLFYLRMNPSTMGIRYLAGILRPLIEGNRRNNDRQPVTVVRPDESSTTQQTTDTAKSTQQTSGDDGESTLTPNRSSTDSNATRREYSDTSDDDDMSSSTKHTNKRPRKVRIKLVTKLKTTLQIENSKFSNQILFSLQDSESAASSTSNAPSAPFPQDPDLIYYNDNMTTAQMVKLREKFRKVHRKSETDHNLPFEDPPYRAERRIASGEVLFFFKGKFFKKISDY